jgi:hypothetical protein
MDLSHIPARASFDWRQIAVTPRDIWVCGVDLGQACDSTAIGVLHYTRVPTDNWVPNLKAETWKQESVTRYDVVHLQRLPLGISYVEQVQRVAEILAREPLRDRAEMVVDQSGVGAGVCDLLDNAGLRPNRIVITAGLGATRHGGVSGTSANSL